MLDTPPLLANADATPWRKAPRSRHRRPTRPPDTKPGSTRLPIMASMRLSLSGIIITGEVEEGVYGYGYKSTTPANTIAVWQETRRSASLHEQWIP